MRFLQGVVDTPDLGMLVCASRSLPGHEYRGIIHLPYADGVQVVGAEIQRIGEGRFRSVFTGMDRLPLLPGAELAYRVRSALEDRLVVPDASFSGLLTRPEEGSMQDRLAVFMQAYLNHVVPAFRHWLRDEIISNTAALRAADALAELPAVNYHFALSA